jgi:hypothetical protein
MAARLTPWARASAAMETPRSWYAVAPQLGGSQRGRVVVGGVDLDQREVRRVVVEALF